MSKWRVLPPEETGAGRVYRCRRCGLAVQSRRSLTRGGYCITCSAAQLRAGIEQMAAKSGPVYERWVRSMRSYIARIQAPPPEGAKSSGQD